MNQYLILIIGIIVGGFLVWLTAHFWILKKIKKWRRQDLEAENKPGLAGQAKVQSKTPKSFQLFNQKRKQLKKERQEKILALLAKQGQITNNEVQKLLGVADATATNYLDDLEKQGKIKQKGGTGRGVVYRAPD